MTATTIFEPARVWLRRGELDRRLARGAHPSDSPMLARRARQLTSRRMRAGLAAGIHNVLDAADEPPRGYSAAVPVQRGEILKERPLLVAVAGDLLSDDDLSPRGIALVEELLRDGSSPLYVSTAEGALHGAVVHARATLHLF
jgi:hypothetical protein